MRESKLERWLPWLLASIVVVLGQALWTPFPPGVWHDDGVYVLLARSLAEGTGLRYLGVPGEPLAPKFPPLYPLLLAAGWRLHPSFPENLGVLSGLNLVILGGAAAVLFVYLRRSLRLPILLAFGVSALAWTAPQLWRVAVVTLSEPTFVLTLLLALWAAARMEARPTPGAILLFLGAGALAFHARTVGVAALGGGVLALWIRGHRRAAVGAAAGTAAVTLPWIVWSRRATDALPGPLRDILGGYGGWLAEQVVEGPASFAAYLGGNAVHVVARVLALLLPGVTGWHLWLGVVLLVPLGIGLREVGRRTLALPLALGLSLLVLVVWPFQDIRLVVPFGPLLVLATAVGLHRLAGGGGGGLDDAGDGLGVAGVGGGDGACRPPAWRRGGAAALGAAWVGVAAVGTVATLTSGWVDRPYRVRSETVQAGLRTVAGNTPPGAVVGAPEMWAGIHLFTGRSAVPSARFRPLAAGVGAAEGAGGAPGAPGGRRWGTPRQQHELWMAAEMTHVLVEHGGRVHGEALERIDAVCGPEALRTLGAPPGPPLVALAWDADCRAELLSGGEAAQQAEEGG